jgi:hypothetical protein
MVQMATPIPRLDGTRITSCGLEIGSVNGDLASANWLLVGFTNTS